MTSPRSGAEFVTPLTQAVDEAQASYFVSSVGEPIQKVRSPMRFMSRQTLAKLLCYSKVFEMTSGVSGSIVECGVYFGQGLMTWAKLSAALEPYNYSCRVVGFDTFEGSVGYDPALDGELVGLESGDGGYRAHPDIQADLLESIQVFNMDRPLNQFPKVELVPGDVRGTAPSYVDEHPGSLVRVLSLSMNLYEPTYVALSTFVPRMPKGAVVVMFTLNSDLYPGMTRAVLDFFGGQPEFKTFPFYPNLSYLVINGS